MAEQYYPFDAGAGSAIFEADWAKLWRGAGVGVVPDVDLELRVDPNPATMQTIVKSGIAFCFGHAYVNTSDKTLTHASNTNPGTTRYDRVVVTWNFTSNTATAQVVQGTAAASPTVPAITQDLSASLWQHHLALVKVAYNDASIDAADVFAAEDRWVRSTDATPRGTITPYALTALPDGYCWCNGVSFEARKWLQLRSDLPAYTAGRFGYDAATELIYPPDMRGRAPFGVDSMGGAGDASRLDITNAVGVSGGAQYVGLTINNVPGHTHGVAIQSGGQSANHDHGVAVDTGGLQAVVGLSPAGPWGIISGAGGSFVTFTPITAYTGGTSVDHSHGVNGATDSGQWGPAGTGHENMPPYTTCNYIMRGY